VYILLYAQMGSIKGVPGLSLTVGKENRLETYSAEYTDVPKALFTPHPIDVI